MKFLKKVNALEVKRTFVVADFISVKKDRRKHLNFVPKNIFKEKLKNAKEKTIKLKESKLDKIIGDDFPRRLKGYNACDWYLVLADIHEIGVWKRAGSLPLAWTKGDLADTAKIVKRALQYNPKLLKKRARYSIPNMLKTNVNLLQKEKYLLPIVFENGVGTNGRKGFNKNVKGDIDDGCMRSVTLAVSGVKSIKAYFGIMKSSVRQGDKTQK